MVKISPEWVTGPEQGKCSGRIAVFSLWNGVLKERRTTGYTWTDYKTNAQITKELKITPILDKLLEPRNRLPRVMKHYSQTVRRNHGRTLKRLLDT